MARRTSAQTFAGIFNRFVAGATPEEKKTAEDKMDAWLKRHGKTRIDIQAILAQAAADDAAASPPPPDPRDAGTNQFDDLEITAAGLVEYVVAQYVWMPPHLLVIFTLCICLTHVYRKFQIAPRVAFVSDEARQRQNYGPGRCPTVSVSTKPGSARLCCGD